MERRDFLVDVTVNGIPQPTEPVMARDALDAENFVRRRLNRRDDVFTFSFDLVREVRTAWSPETGRYEAPVIHIAPWWEHAITVMHR
jgi:hypothetical protein